MEKEDSKEWLLGLSHMTSPWMAEAIPSLRQRLVNRLIYFLCEECTSIPFPKRQKLPTPHANRGGVHYTLANACSTSAIRSSLVSMPTLKRTNASVIPKAWRVAAGTEAWVMIAG